MRFQKLESLRAISILLVLSSHWLHGGFWDYLPLGKYGVDIFFTISGFLITKMLIEASLHNTQAIAKTLFYFYWHRALRILPLYCLTLLFGFLFFQSQVQQSWLWHFFIASNFYIMHYNAWPPLLGHFWSLSVELHFYLLWPVALLIIPFSGASINQKLLKQMIYIFLFSGLLCRLAMYLMSYNYLWLYVFTPNCFDALGAGALLAYYYLFEKQNALYLLKSKRILFICMALLVLILLLPLFDFYHTWPYVIDRFLLSIISFYLCGFAVFDSQGFKIKALDWPALIYVGNISYALYLLHNYMPALLLAINAKSHNMYLNFLIMALLCFLLASLMHYLIERPVARLKKKHFTVA